MKRKLKKSIELGLLEDRGRSNPCNLVQLRQGKKKEPKESTRSINE